jgi:hypothetical protein
MSDWDFLHDMHDRGYSPRQIADAAACGYNPWEWQPVDNEDLLKEAPNASPELVEVFERLVDTAVSYRDITGRYLQIWGELGELYAEVRYGVRRHKPHTAGSDGKLGNDYIEVKTISREKSNSEVQVKRAGNFNRLLVVKISEDFQFESRMLDRKRIPTGEGTHAKVEWENMPSSAESGEA